MINHNTTSQPSSHNFNQQLLTFPSIFCYNVKLIQLCVVYVSFVIYSLNCLVKSNHLRLNSPNPIICLCQKQQ